MEVDIYERLEASFNRVDLSFENRPIDLLRSETKTQLGNRFNVHNYFSKVQQGGSYISVYDKVTDQEQPSYLYPSVLGSWSSILTKGKMESGAGW